MNDKLIPKKIHYVWFGNNEKPEKVKECIDSWKKFMPEYEIIEWNEQNFDVNSSCDYVKEAFSQKKWAFVSDYIRLYALWSEGGIYFDTDLEALKNFDPLLQDDGFLSFENSFSLCTAVIGAKKNSKWVKEILDLYEKRRFIIDGKCDLVPNTRYIFDFLHKEYSLDYVENIQKLPSGLVIYTKDYFSPLNSATGKLKITENSFAIHHYSNSWISFSGKVKRRLRMIITRVIGENNKEKIRNLINKKR